MNIKSGPHYSISTAEFANWIDDQIDDQPEGMWWSIEGDSYIASRMGIPCMAEELASFLRRHDRTLLIQAPPGVPALGEPIHKSKIRELARKISDEIYQIDKSKPPPIWANDRCFWMSWKDGNRWLLMEDSDYAKAYAGSGWVPRAWSRLNATP